MVKLKYYSLGSVFQIVKTENFDNEKLAFEAAKKYGEENGFTKVKTVADEDYEVRVTATTPNGRAGRNIACIEFGWEE